MAVTVRKITLWRREAGDRAGLMAETLAPLAAAGVSLKVAMGYHQPGGGNQAALEVASVTGKKATAAAQSAGLAASSISTLLVEGDDRPGLGHALARAIADAGINLDFLVARSSAESSRRSSASGTRRTPGQPQASSRRRDGREKSSAWPAHGVSRGPEVGQRSRRPGRRENRIGGADVRPRGRLFEEILRTRGNLGRARLEEGEDRLRSPAGGGARHLLSVRARQGGAAGGRRGRRARGRGDPSRIRTDARPWRAPRRAPRPQAGGFWFARALMPVSPPRPIVSTALDGTMTIEPFSLIAS